MCFPAGRRRSSLADRSAKPFRHKAAGLVEIRGIHAGPAARAAIEEFENWSIGERERDDENGLDDLLRGFPPWADWRWRLLGQGARGAMGCATTERWEVNLDAKLRRQVTERLVVSYRHRQQEELGESVTWSEFGASYRWPAGLWWGATYRPSFEKESHDVGLFAGFQRDTLRWARLHLGVEDVLNDFWDRRTRHIVDKRRRVYARQPLEWDLSALVKWERGGAAVRAVWLPDYEREATPAPSESLPPSRRRVSGALLDLDLIATRGAAWACGLRGRFKGADRLELELAGPASSVVVARDDARLRDLRLRPWFEWRHSSPWRLRGIAQAIWSSERHYDGAIGSRLETQHLGGLAVAIWEVRPFLDLEVGLGAERIHVRQTGPSERHFFTHGTRTESRAVVSIDLHAGVVAEQECVFP